MVELGASGFRYGTLYLRQEVTVPGRKLSPKNIRCTIAHLYFFPVWKERNEERGGGGGGVVGQHHKRPEPEGQTGGGGEGGYRFIFNN